MKNGTRKNRRRLPILAVALVFLSEAKDLYAVDAHFGVGAAAGRDPALSIQYNATPQTAYHVTAHVASDDAGFSADYQHFLVPSFGRGRGWTLSFYSGFGVAGASERDKDTEDYSLRLPLGTQCDLEDVSLSTFFEVAPQIGPLPMTTVAGVVTGGLRARF